MVQMKPLAFNVDPAKVYSTTLSDSRIFIIVLGSGQIDVFNFQGEREATIGRKGQGPGEFGFPAAVHYDEPFLYVMDNAKQKLFRIDPESGQFLQDWELQPTNAIYVSEEKLLTSFNVKNQAGMFAFGSLDAAFEPEHFFHDSPCCLDVQGSKRSGVLIDARQNLWTAYSGTYELTKYSPDGKKLRTITKAPPDYVAPSTPGKTSSYDRKRLAAHFRSFDKIAGLYEVLDYVALYRFKSNTDRKLDLYRNSGEYIRTLPVDQFTPIGSRNKGLYFLMLGKDSDEWDVRLAQMIFN